MLGIPSYKSIAFGTSELITLSNNYRINNGVTPLQTDEKLTNSAQAKADDMATKGYFDHDAPDGTTPWYFFDMAGYSYNTAGENLALTNMGANAVVDGWFESPSHKANLLSQTFSEVGYGIAYVPSFTYQSKTYTKVYLVAAHYGDPADPVVVSNLAPSGSQPQQESYSGNSAAEGRVSQPTNDTQTQNASTLKSPETPEPIATSNNKINTSGTIVEASTEPMRISSALLYAGAGAGMMLLFIGICIEIKRLLKGQPLIPHHL